MDEREIHRIYREEEEKELDRFEMTGSGSVLNADAEVVLARVAERCGVSVERVSEVLRSRGGSWLPEKKQVPY